jgi:cytoskeletal protein RodZ
MTPTNLKNNPSSSLLKDTRIAKGLTLDIVHEATKIPMDALRAIEEGYSTKMLTPFYYRGFVKIYAEFLGLNTVEVLKEYNVKPPEIKTTIVKPSTVRPAKKASAPVGKTSNPFGEQFQEFWRVFWTPKNQKNLLRIAMAIVALIVVVKIVGCVASAMKSKSKTPKVMATTKVVKKIKKEMPKEEVKAVDVADEEEAAAVKEKTVAAPVFNRKVTLAVHASRDTNIQVKADGKIVFQMTMKKGTVENWEADNQIELSGKNIGELDLEVNGKDIGNLSSSNRRAKKMVITKEGLTVKK